MGDYGQDIQHLRFSSYPIVPLSAAMHESLSLLFLFRHSSNPIRPFLPLSLTGEQPPLPPLSFLRPSHSHRRTDRDGEKNPLDQWGERTLSPPFPSFPFRSFSVSSVNAIAPPPFLSSSLFACGLAAAGGKGRGGEREEGDF